MVNELLRANSLVGSAYLKEAEPLVDVQENVVFRPFDPVQWLGTPDWGIYDLGGRIIESASYRRLPRRDYVGQKCLIDSPSARLPVAPDAEYIYAGPCISHFGHFITALLPRLWFLTRSGAPDFKLICHSIEHPKDWIARDYAHVFLDGLNLTERNFAFFTEPTLIRRLYIPEPALEEQHFAHPVFRELCEKIGRPYLRPATDRAVYLSRSKLGYPRYLEEAVIEDAARRRGIEIVYPETLSVPDQICLLSSTRTVAGIIGSAFHSTIFTGQAKNVVGMCYGNEVNANFALIDLLNENRASYWYPAITAPAFLEQKDYFPRHVDDIATIAETYVNQVLA